MGLGARARWAPTSRRSSTTKPLREFRDRSALPLSDEDVAQLRLPPWPRARDQYPRAPPGAGWLCSGQDDEERETARAVAFRDRGNQSTTMACSCSFLRSSSRTRSLDRASCRSSRTRRAPSACRRCSGRSASTPRSASSTTEDHDELYYREAKDGQILEGDHQAGAFFVARRGDLVFGARQADASVLHLLLHLRLPARRRSHLGVGGLARARFPRRRHGGPHHARRRRAAAPGRLVAPHRRDIPNCRAYDPWATGYLAAIVEDGALRMLEAQE